MSSPLPSHARGLTVLAALCAAYGIQSLAGAIWLFPFWLMAVRKGNPGSGSFAWVQLATALSALTAAYGMWRRRRWTWLPFLACLLISVASLVFIALFALGDLSHTWTRAAAGVFAAFVAAIAAWLMRYVWRSTRQDV